MFESPLKLDSPWHEFLAAIDEQLTAPAQIICIGGLVVTNAPRSLSRTYAIARNRFACCLASLGLDLCRAVWMVGMAPWASVTGRTMPLRVMFLLPKGGDFLPLKYATVCSYDLVICPMWGCAQIYPDGEWSRNEPRLEVPVREPMWVKRSAEYDIHSYTKRRHAVGGFRKTTAGYLPKLSQPGTALSRAHDCADCCDALRK